MTFEYKSANSGPDHRWVVLPILLAAAEFKRRAARILRNFISQIRANGNISLQRSLLDRLQKGPVQLRISPFIDESVLQLKEYALELAYLNCVLILAQLIRYSERS